MHLQYIKYCSCFVKYIGQYIERSTYIHCHYTFMQSTHTIWCICHIHICTVRCHVQDVQFHVYACTYPNTYISCSSALQLANECQSTLNSWSPTSTSLLSITCTFGTKTMRTRYYIYVPKQFRSTAYSTKLLYKLGQLVSWLINACDTITVCTR